MVKLDKLEIHFDASPDGRACTWDNVTNRCATVPILDDPITNNIAEYEGLIFALKRAQGLLKCFREIIPKEIILKGDSRLVIEQTKMQWGINKLHLSILRKRVFEELIDLTETYWGKVTLKWIPREKNKAGIYIEELQKHE